MDIVHILARVLGITMLLVGISMFNKKNYEAAIDDVERHRGLLWIYGLVAFIMGIVVLALHNAWEAHWPVIITILGWLMIIKGAMITLFPEATVWMYKKVKTGGVVRFSCLVAIVIGLYLLVK